MLSYFPLYELFAVSIIPEPHLLFKQDLDQIYSFRPYSLLGICHIFLQSVLLLCPPVFAHFSILAVIMGNGHSNRLFLDQNELFLHEFLICKVACSMCTLGLNINNVFLQRFHTYMTEFVQLCTTVDTFKFSKYFF